MSGDKPRRDRAGEVGPEHAGELDEAAWYRRVYRPAERQLTVRAIATGMVLGFVLSFSNVYIGLKTGWFFGVALAACLVSFALWRGFAAIGLARTPLSLLETNCMQSTASSAAYATGNMVVGVIPALLLMSVSSTTPAGVQPAWPALAAWIACIAALGVTLAIPLKRQLINHERLAFPSGTAAAIMLHGLHRGGEAVVVRGRLLIAAIGVGAVLPVLRDLRSIAIVPASSRLFDWIPTNAAYRAGDAGLVLDHSVLLASAGVFVGLRTAAWALAGGVITAFVLGPLALASGAASAPSMLWADVGTWIGAPLLVGYALVALVARWRAFVATFRPPVTAARDSVATAEIPARWFWIGFSLCGVCAIVLGYLLFGIPIVLGVLAVMLSLVFGAVACRIAGETDITPGGPMGKLTQLGFGAAHPQHPSTNLMTAAMTHASSVAAADLLNDLKSGYLLGADPRRQFVAQALGIGVGTAASVIAYFLLVPDAYALLGTGAQPPAFAAPGAHQFQAIAELLQRGLDGLHPMQRTLVIVGMTTGVVVAAIERAVPERARRWVPSSAGLGLGLLLPASTSLAMTLGALVAAIATRRDRAVGQRTVWPAAAGALAGESLAGVAVALINAVTR
ncbi:MAG: OPT family oligopeptide transporter [Kofleriaceae bacterium]